MRPPVRSIARSLTASLAVGMLLAGCTAASATNLPPDASTATPTTHASTTPAASAPATKYVISSDPNGLVLRIDTAGGLVAPGYFLTHLPQFSLYADGRVIAPGAVDAIYPGPLLPNLEETRLSPDDVQRLLAAADRAGLLGPDASFDAGGVADAGTTVFTTTVDGKTHRISAYALGISQDPSPQTDILAARSRLLAFESSVFDLPALLGHSVSKAAYVAAAGRVYTGEPAEAQPPMTQQELAWPLAIDPASGSATTNPGLKCLAVKGVDWTAFVAAAKSANALTVWKAPNGKYSVQVRPLLPGESGCA